jgi:hypothetical protein
MKGRNTRKDRKENRFRRLGKINPPEMGPTIGR